MYIKLIKQHSNKLKVKVSLLNIPIMVKLNNLKILN
jgi:hypothetical protein